MIGTHTLALELKLNSDRAFRSEFNPRKKYMLKKIKSSLFCALYIFAFISKIYAQPTWSTPPLNLGPFFPDFPQGVPASQVTVDGSGTAYAIWPSFDGTTTHTVNIAILPKCAAEWKAYTLSTFD